jgi:hypothetical protein
MVLSITVFKLSIFNLYFSERERTMQQANMPPFAPQRTDGPRFTGGGFNLQAPKAVA